MISFDRLTRIMLEEACEFLVTELPEVEDADLVIQVGSGQASDNLLDEEWRRLSLRSVPHMPREESLADHELEVRWGCIGEFKVLIYAGRYHYYEGYGRVPIILPIWAAAACGARNFMIANASGAINRQLAPGDLMVVADHINNLGVSPLAGHHHLLADAYVNMRDVYSRTFADSFLEVAAKENVNIIEGVYMANLGPHFETPAEVRAAESMGADVLGMSTVMEATVAHAVGAKVLATSMIMNHASGLGNGRISHGEAKSVGKSAGKTLVRLIRRWLAEKGQEVL